MNEGQQLPDIELKPAVKYETQVWWAIFPTSGNSEPRFLKLEPQRLAAHEVALRMEVAVPKMEKRLIQSIRIEIPVIHPQVASLTMAVPESGS